MGQCFVVSCARARSPNGLLVCIFDRICGIFFRKSRLTCDTLGHSLSIFPTRSVFSLSLFDREFAAAVTHSCRPVTSKVHDPASCAYGHATHELDRRDFLFLIARKYDTTIYAVPSMVRLLNPVRDANLESRVPTGPLSIFQENYIDRVNV